MAAYSMYYNRLLFSVGIRTNKKRCQNLPSITLENISRPRQRCGDDDFKLSRVVGRGR
jgi:hypothetical protein